MATATIPRDETVRTPFPRHYRLTVEQYERMSQLGILTTQDRVELLEGWIIGKMTQNPPHNIAIDLTRDRVSALLPPEWRIREQKAIRLSDSEPEPDLSIVQSPITRYARRHPTAADIGLLIEVSDTSLADDRGWKGRIYARARIPVYWIVNLVDSQVEVYTEPKAGKAPVYRQCQVFGKKDSVPLIIAGWQLGLIAVRDLLP